MHLCANHQLFRAFLTATPHLLPQRRNPIRTVMWRRSSGSSLPWGRKEDEDDRRFAYRCMMQAHKMLKPTQPKRGISGRR
ncbi:uncharacterized protein BN813_00713 [Bacteroides sp. CAG:927]|nr:uncharacterized protein BN813_00713 [Bacteroides sp. CAG:927]